MSVEFAGLFRMHERTTKKGKTHKGSQSILLSVISGKKEKQRGEKRGRWGQGEETEKVDEGGNFYVVYWLCQM